MTTWKDQIVERFDKAAPTYAGGAASQRWIARKLRERVLQEGIAGVQEVLEIGCGTGFLTAALLDDLGACRWLATDISPRMLEHCSIRMDPRVTLRVMDGEHPDLGARKFDLIVSSMALQWFQDLGAGLEKLHSLLQPGGLLAVTTLGSDTFREWRKICLAEGCNASNPGYPTEGELQRRLGSGAKIHREPLPVSFDDLKGFLDHLKGIGARTAAAGHPPMTSGTLRRILRAWEGHPFTATYDVLTVLWRKPVRDTQP
jgi:malonyl-CoA O-methyltransferase